MTWDPCREIRYEINPAGAPGGDDDAINLVRQAVATVSDISGLQFAYDGTTQRRPQWETRWTPVGRSEPVLISWATEDEVPQLKGNVAGIGGSVARSIGTNARAHYVTGGVTLDIDSFADIDDRDRSAIVLHELGHVLGLDHVESSDELMYADNLGRTRFGTGDLNGLVRLGQGSCG